MTFARNAAEAPAADGRSTLPWTMPLHRSQAVALVGIVRTAAIIAALHLVTVLGPHAAELDRPGTPGRSRLFGQGRRAAPRRRCRR